MGKIKSETIIQFDNGHDALKFLRDEEKNWCPDGLGTCSGNFARAILAILNSFAWELDGLREEVNMLHEKNRAGG